MSLEKYLKGTEGLLTSSEAWYLPDIVDTLDVARNSRLDILSAVSGALRCAECGRPFCLKDSIWKPRCDCHTKAYQLPVVPWKVTYGSGG